MPTAPDGRQQRNNASLDSQVAPVPVHADPVTAEPVTAEPVTAGPVTAEPVTAEAARRVRRALLTQHWLDLTFLHWPIDPDAVAPLLPAGTRPDQFGGTSYVGLIAFRMHRIGWLGLAGLPYLGSFPETNVRLYSVGSDGRRGVVFRSLEAARLAPVVVARLGFRLPYAWARMAVDRRGDTLTYTSQRRWPGPRWAASRLTIRVGDPIPQPSDLELFLTARWGLQATWHGQKTFYLPNDHPRWSLYHAQLLDLDENLVRAAGLPAPAGDPVSVLYSPGVPVRFGAPA
jgi:uncharacterized protein YqjF (DUF2071 family)